MDKIEVKLNTLIELSLNKQYEQIKSILQNAPLDEKGKLFEHYIAALYKGNGWLTKVTGSKNDAGGDVLLYHPKSPGKVAFIVQTKNHNKRLSFDDTRIELVKFEEQGTKKYHCQQFYLFSLNGYVEEAKKLSDFNMVLYGWKKITSLIKNYSTKFKQPSLELLPHNQIAYEKIQKALNEGNKASCVHATGTGKSYIIAQSIIDTYPNKSLVLAPNRYILEGPEKICPSFNDQVIYMTYAKAANLTELEIAELNPSLIVFDEFHRAGAEKWGEGVEMLLIQYPDVPLLGTSATHIRYLDSARNMADELFEGVIASELSLPDAIARQILPVPNYISALYTVDGEIEKLTDKINKTIDNKDKSKALKALDKIKVDWESTSGVPEILNKHLPELAGKYIIFCEDKEHLDAMQDEVSAWFRKAAKKRGQLIDRKRYIVYHELSEKQNDLTIDNFKSANSDNAVHLLFSINMFNEGIHIDGVNRALLLRKTASPNIYFQQIGRCFDASLGEENSIIFDLVNNIENILANSFEESLNEAFIKENTRRKCVGLSEILFEFRINDCKLQIMQKLNEFIDIYKLNRTEFETGFMHLMHFKKKNGHCLVPRTHKTDDGYKLGIWVGTIRYEYKIKRKSLTEERINILESIGFVWNIIEFEFNQKVDYLIAYKNDNGHLDISNNHVSPDGLNIGLWMQYLRARYNNNSLEQNRIDTLDKIGFVWDVINYRFDKYIVELQKYYSKYGHYTVSHDLKLEDGFAFGLWVSSLRNKYKNNKLSVDKIETLEKIGFDWAPLVSRYHKGIKYLKQFKEEFGHCEVPSIHITKEGNFALGSWVGNIRGRYKNNKLSPGKVLELEKISFTWDVIESKYQSGLFYLKQFKNEFGHCEVPDGFITNKGNFALGDWVLNKRNQYKNGKLTKKRTIELEKLGFVWDFIGHKNQRHLNYLKVYKEKNGHCDVSINVVNGDGFKLGVWVSHQRRNYKKGKLSQELIIALDSIGFSWDINEKRNKQAFDSLKKFKEINGHFRIPKKYIDEENGIGLGIWITNKKTAYKNNKLSKEEISKFEAIGYIWDPFNHHFLTGLYYLKEYKSKQGNCLVPCGYIIDKENDNFKLGAWVADIRTRYRKNKLSEQNINRLEVLGFDWNPSETKHKIAVQYFIEYKEEFGNCNVPAAFINDDDFALGSWVKGQRIRYKEKKLSVERFNELDSIGFIWKHAGAGIN